MINKINTVLFILILATSLTAQKELGLHFMSGIWQSNRTNPAFSAPYKVTVAGLEIGNNLSMAGPSFDQMMVRENGTTTIDINRVIDLMYPENSIREELDISLLSLGIKIKNLNLNLGHSVKGYAFLKYPKTLPEIVLRGNAPYIGKTIMLSPEIQMGMYQEFSLGASYKVNNLSFGAKAKFLNGIMDLSTDKNRHEVSLHTDSDVYQLTITGDYILNTANSLGHSIYDSLNAEFNIDDLAFGDLLKGNSGMAFDIGVLVEMDKWQFAISLIDIGKINWDKGLTNFTSNKTVKYSGLDISGSLTGEGIDFEQALDTLGDILDIDKSRNPYSTSLPSKAYMSARYKLTEKLTAGGMFFMENYRGDSYTAFALGINAALLRGLNIGATYAVKGDTYDNLGLNLAITLGPFQAYAVTDNFLAAINPMKVRHVNFRFGGNLVFGKLNKKKKEEVPVPLKLY